MCMNSYYGIEIGNSIGKVVDVDVEVDDTRCGRFLRVIEVPSTKILLGVDSSL